MKIFILLLSLLSSLSTYAAEFDTCGTYLIKGILREDLSAPKGLSYYVNEGSKSQMKFIITEMSDASSLLIVLDKESSFTGKILNHMNGTTGTVREASKISLRFPDPLNSESTGISKIKEESCD